MVLEPQCKHYTLSRCRLKRQADERFNPELQLLSVQPVIFSPFIHLGLFLGCEVLAMFHFATL